MVREPASLQLLVYSPFLREEHLVLRVQIFPTKTAWSFRNRLFLGKTDPPPPGLLIATEAKLQALKTCSVFLDFWGERPWKSWHFSPKLPSSHPSQENPGWRVVRLPSVSLRGCPYQRLTVYFQISKELQSPELQNLLLTALEGEWGLDF